MTESILTLSIVGFLAGFICSMPIAGPISILIASNAFKGRFRYCNLVNIGASFATFSYVFLVVFGLTKLFTYFKTAIPYLFSAGFVILIIIGYRILRTKFDVEYFEDKPKYKQTIEENVKGGFYTGLIINFFNPTLFIGWLINTFLVFSFIASLGFNTGGLDRIVDQSVKEINNAEGIVIDELLSVSINKSDIAKTQRSEFYIDKLTRFPGYYHLVISVLYALFVSAGSLIWFYILTLLITRFRQYINTKIISVFIKCMGVVLCLFGLYFGYQAAKMFFTLKI